MEPTQQTCFPDLREKWQLEHIAAEEDRYLQPCLAHPPVSAEELLLLHGGNYQFRHPCGTVPSYVSQHSQDARDAQEACGEALMAMPRCLTARSADCAAYLRVATQSEFQVPQISYDAYAQQPNFALPSISATPVMPLSGCREAFVIDPQPPVGHSGITKSALEVCEQLIHTVLLKVRAGELREIVGYLMDNLQCLKTHIKAWGEPTVYTFDSCPYWH
jgi:hypothetical protein